MTAQRFYQPGLMDLSAYSFRPALIDAEWTNFLSRAEHSTIFTDVSFLTPIQDQIKAFYCYKNKELQAAVLYVPGGDERQFARDFCIQNGIVFGSLNAEQNEAQKISERFRITCAIIDFLVETEKEFSLTLGRTFQDLRPFLWHGYGNESIQKFSIGIRYTSLLEIQTLSQGLAGFDASHPFLKNMTKSRRQELRRSYENSGEASQISEDVDGFVELYQRTYAMRGIERPKKEMTFLKEVMLSLQTAGKGVLFSCKDSQGQPLSMAFFGIHNAECYYLYGVNELDRTSSSAGTRVIFDALKFCASKGCTTADMEGINSPKRGFFKLSFGGSITPYHQVSYEAV